LQALGGCVWKNEQHNFLCHFLNVLNDLSIVRTPPEMCRTSVLILGRNPCNIIASRPFG